MRIPVAKSLVLLSLCALVAACSRAPQPASTPPLARVGEEVITDEAFIAEAKRRGIGPDDAARKALLEEMVRDLRLVHHARTRGFDRDEEASRALRAFLIDRAKADLGESGSGTPTGVGDTAIEEYYRTHAEEFRVAARVRAAMIFVAKPKGDVTRARAKAEAARAAVVAAAAEPTAHFGPLAVDFSEDQATRYLGGDLGYQVEGRTSAALDAAAARALFAMEQPGTLSDLVETEQGFYVFKLLERHPASTLPLSAARNRIRARLQAEQAAERQRSFEAALAVIPASIDSSRLAQLPLPPAPPRSDPARATPAPMPGARQTTAQIESAQP